MDTRIENIVNDTFNVVFYEVKEEYLNNKLCKLCMENACTRCNACMKCFCSVCIINVDMIECVFCGVSVEHVLYLHHHIRLNMSMIKQFELLNKDKLY